MNLYKKMTKIITVSLSNEDKEFLDNNPELSPTKMLRAQIIQVRENRSELKAELIRAKNNVIKQGAIIKELGNKINVLEEKKLRE